MGAPFTLRRAVPRPGLAMELSQGDEDIKKHRDPAWRSAARRSGVCCKRGVSWICCPRRLPPSPPVPPFGMLLLCCRPGLLAQAAPCSLLSGWLPQGGPCAKHTLSVPVCLAVNMLLKESYLSEWSLLSDVSWMGLYRESYPLDQ